VTAVLEVASALAREDRALFFSIGQLSVALRLFHQSDRHVAYQVEHLCGDRAEQQSADAIQSPYFVLDATIAEALAAAALAGIKVRVMLTARASGDPVPGWASNTYVQDVVAAGVRVFLYEKGYLHAKTISVDSEICSIGSANIDIRSFSINYEINAVLYSKQLAMELEEDFERDLAHCTEFHAGEYLARNPAVRFRDSVARLLSPLL